MFQSFLHDSSLSMPIHLSSFPRPGVHSDRYFFLFFLVFDALFLCCSGVLLYSDFGPPNPPFSIRLLFSRLYCFVALVAPGVGPSPRCPFFIFLCSKSSESARSFSVVAPLLRTISSMCSVPPPLPFLRAFNLDCFSFRAPGYPLSRRGWRDLLRPPQAPSLNPRSPSSIS